MNDSIEYPSNVENSSIIVESSIFSEPTKKFSSLNILKEHVNMFGILEGGFPVLINCVTVQQCLDGQRSEAPIFLNVDASIGFVIRFIVFSLFLMHRLQVCLWIWRVWLYRMFHNREYKQLKGSFFRVPLKSTHSILQICA